MNTTLSSSTAVVGLQFGDEGKGQVVDRIAADHDVIVRFNGGANAGHTVRLGDEKHALHQLPSGVLTPGKMNVIAEGAVVDPDGLLEEIAGLAAKGVGIGENLRVSLRAHLVMPWHFVEDGLRGRSIGTTKRGIGPCYADKAHRDSAFRIADLFEPKTLRDRITHAVAVKNATLGALTDLMGEPFTPFDEQTINDLCGRWADRLTPFAADTSDLLDRARAAGKRILFEGAHAALLDVEHGTYPFVTSSRCTATATGADTVIGVAKAYMSRVGEGPFPTEIHGDDADDLRRRGAEYGTTTGRPRRVGWLDLVALRHAARRAGVTEIALTGLKVLAGLDTVRIATAYRIDGETTDRFPPHAAALDRAEPVYEEIPGAEDAILERIEADVAPVRWVAHGRKREELVRI